MRAVVIREHGSYDRLQFEDRPAPEPGPGQIRVAVHAAGLNHLDTWVRRGVPGHAFPLPIVPGCDGLEALGLFCAAVLASPVPLRSRLAFAAIGSVGVFAINILRIVSLFLVGAHFPKRFELLHWDLWPGLLILVIMSSWMIWARRAFRAHVREAPPPEGK